VTDKKSFVGRAGGGGVVVDPPHTHQMPDRRR
jgi:hypothetical protein